MISVVNKICLALTVLLSTRAALAQPNNVDDVYGPVQDVDIAAYLGRWYQTHASFTVKYTFQLGANCGTADYALAETDDDSVVVVVRNTVRPFGRRWPISVNGFAVQEPGFPQSGALTVEFKGGFFGPAGEPEEASFEEPGNYWIVALGPKVDIDGVDQYDWAVVANEGKTQLYILTRDFERFNELYEDEVLGRVKAMGFTRLFNKPLVTKQKKSCYVEFDDE